MNDSAKPQPEPATRQRIADYLTARTRGLCVIRTDAVVAHEGWTGPAPMVIRPGSRMDPYALALGQVDWKGALLDLVDGRTNCPVVIPASVLREWLARRYSETIVSEDWTAKRDPRWPGVAECNGVGGLGGGFAMQWDDLRRIAEAA